MECKKGFFRDSCTSWFFCPFEVLDKQALVFPARLHPPSIEKKGFEKHNEEGL